MDPKIFEDPESRKLIDDFCQESSAYYNQLEKTLEELEDDPTQDESFKSFAQTIGHVMKSAKLIDLKEIGLITELGKTVSVKSSKVQEPELREIVIDILFDSLDLLRKLNDGLETYNMTKMQSIDYKAFSKRLEWLDSKFKSTEKPRPKKADENIETQRELTDLIKSLGA